uniref:Uncharacterized protein n=1 Tax=Marseillevirus LCMAC101 TaxID=2506602 RepID=A0A481YSI5_9VIRU|nr:MAG: hypothetical protein LCMAC101_00230 [Marseillevirus LCMAC101]
MSAIQKFQNSKETLSYLHDQLTNERPWDFIQEKMLDFMIEQNGNLYIPFNIADKLFELNMKVACGAQSEKLLTSIIEEVHLLLKESSDEESTNESESSEESEKKGSDEEDESEKKGSDKVAQDIPDVNHIVINPSVDIDGIIRTRDINRRLHSFGDNPAAIHPNGMVEWYQHGVRHRNNQPAIVNGWTTGYNQCSENTEEVHFQRNAFEFWNEGVLHNPQGAARHCDHLDEWRDSEGQLHREDDRPAKIVRKGQEKSSYLVKYWYRHGKNYREDNQPTMVNSNGQMEWYDLEGKLHRDKGPARIFPDDCFEWYQHGNIHRDECDYPASICVNGGRRWYRNGKLHREPCPITGEDNPADITFNGYIQRFWKDREEYYPKFTRARAPETGYMGTVGAGDTAVKVYYFRVGVYGPVEMYKKILEHMCHPPGSITSFHDLDKDENIWNFTFIHREKKETHSFLDDMAIILYDESGTVDRTSDIIYSVKGINIIHCFGHECQNFLLKSKRDEIDTIQYKHSFRSDQYNLILESLMRMGKKES